MTGIRRGRPWTAVLLLAALLLLAGCDRPEIHRERFFAFGTLVELNVYTRDAALARAGADAVRADLTRMHRNWHAWEPGPLQEVNQALARGEAIRPDPAVLAPILEARALSQRTEGLFNPAMGRLFALWGFQSDQAAGPPPPPEAVAALLARDPDMADLQLEDGRLSTQNPAVQLDLGAFAKGYGVHRAVDHLQALGIENAILNAGGDLRAIGRPGDRPWRIGIRDPDGQGVLAGIEIRGDEAVFTSGDYERYFTHKETRYHHILDPRTGYPARGSRSVTVIHEDAGLADAASTALFIAGPGHWPRIAARLGVDKVLLLDAKGVAHMTPAMAERVAFREAPAGQRIHPLPGTPAAVGGP
ncbi:FAD:protein FMN transferase [Ectothiorhodospira mobilis]|uniref:FAD:protein FMN transferase n=1 Tax=Ectothiorhodospira mobilis TaxID=195064 RepID=UPI0019074B53|nr:FAD:protein FMN transferase [Ectothiorhodospira mobilis]MBK1692365.1 thiamine biosynthesis protein ApbE [Ectothiorhodospira mobilis]